MSSFWSWWITVISVGNILACYWLIKWASKPHAGEAASGDVTGHKWDENLEEFNNPLPRWWLWLFYITIIFGFVYLYLYPGLGNYKGSLGWTSTGQYNQEIKQANAEYRPIFEAYAQTPIPELAKDPKAVKIGQRLFLNYCATCHGSDAGGVRGFPNLTDGDWLYGGTPEAIEATILDGRNGVMPPWQAALGDEGVDEVTEYVLVLSGRQADATKAEAGKARFATMCAACHGADGKGNTAMGAPNLTDNIWLYGGSRGIIKKTISQGRNGHMPAHRNFLGEEKVHLLAAYIYSLSNP
ncbi:MAG: cytochrome-c oxidase, cbb3-type subunit III [Proteobacteria bacterium]|jgi:cytochrome c oxidase cbb3-type subunit III|nr:cytochrome-c oxidase, cbb3-type subunit III [Pseudomonadota bacterium]MCG6935991.1 cytochrome-c oxidase, cbb3-type subunit III [Pseudomonadota bacterium]